MPKVTLAGTGLRKVFNRRVVFEGVAFSAAAGETLLISGRNGAGKSTLVKIIADVLTPSGGAVTLTVDGAPVRERRQRHLGMVSPYLQLYDEFSALENLRLAQRIRGLPPEEAEGTRLLELFGLTGRRHDPLRAYSSGMKQRVKYMAALLHRPAVLMLDEPMANLDDEGMGAVHTAMEEQRGRGVLVVATNDLSDVDRHEHRIDLHGSR